LRHLIGAFRKPTDWAWASTRRNKAIAPYALIAEPVAAMYQQGRVKHVAAPLAELEDQMCDFGLNGLSSGRSPDRLDALVWAVTELTAGAAGAAHQAAIARRRVGKVASNIINLSLN
jgi:phage terminase large subunit-like protein